jgi:hypothetical protein
MDRNPCSSKEFYRLRCLFIMRGLLTLDRTNASPVEKVITATFPVTTISHTYPQLDALNLYGSEEGELLTRRATHSGLLPEEPFVDFAHKFSDDERD